MILQKINTMYVCVGGGILLRNWAVWWRTLLSVIWRPTVWVSVQKQHGSRLKEQCSVCIQGLRKPMSCTRFWQKCYHFSRESQLSVLSQAFTWLDESWGGVGAGSVLTELPIQVLISKTTFTSTLRMPSDQNLWSRGHRKLTLLMLQLRIGQNIRIQHHAVTLPMCILYPRLTSTSLCSQGWCLAPDPLLPPLPRCGDHRCVYNTWLLPPFLSVVLSVGSGARKVGGL